MALVKVTDLQPGMGVWDERLHRRIEVTAIKINGDVTLVWLSNDGREPVPFPYDTDADVVIDAELRDRFTASPASSTETLTALRGQ